MTATVDLQETHLPARREPREGTVNVVEYSRYPRRLASEGRSVGYTQDRSPSGLGLDLCERVWPGELLQVTLRDIDGTVAVEGLARVVWCREAEGGRAHAGLAMLRGKGERPLMRVRQAGTRTGKRSHVLDSQSVRARESAASNRGRSRLPI